MRPDAVAEQDQTAVLIPPIQSTAAWCVTHVTPLPGYRLAVTFVDGTNGLVDLSQRVHSPKAGIFARLQDISLFNEVHLEYGAVTWPGNLDLAPDAMHDQIKAHGAWVLS